MKACRARPFQAKVGSLAVENGVLDGTGKPLLRATMGSPECLTAMPNEVSGYGVGSWCCVLASDMP